MAITHRVGNPSNLTAAQVDANFDEVAASAAAAAAAAAAKVGPGLITASGLTVSADSKLLGRASGVAGVGPVQEVAIGSGLTLISGVLDAPPSANAYVDLTDNDTAALPVINLPLAAALGAKADAASPVLTGIPTAPTATVGTNTVQLATTAFANAAAAAAIVTLQAGAPSGLNDLNELAAAINDDPAFAATMTSALAGKVTQKANFAITGAGTLTQATHSNAHGSWTGSTPATWAAPVVGSEGDWLEIANNGTSTAVLNISGVTAGTGFTNATPIGQVYEALYTGGAWISRLSSGTGGGGNSTLVDGGNATTDYTGVTAIDGGTATA